MKNNKPFSIEKKQLVKTIDTISKTIKPEILEILKRTETYVASVPNNTRIVTSPLFSDLKLKNDEILFKVIIRTIENYASSIPALKSAIDKNLGTVITNQNTNLNTRLALSLVNIGVFYSYKLPKIVSYLLDKFYKEAEIDVDFYKNIMPPIIELSNLISDTRLLKINDLISVIGKIPVVSNISDEEIPSELITNYAKKELKLSTFAYNFFVKSVGIFGLGSRKPNIAEAFDENPIYKIRIFFTDLKLNGIEKLEDDIRVMELKLLDLKNDLPDNDEEKIKTEKMIKYYENKIVKYRLKLERYYGDI